MRDNGESHGATSRAPCESEELRVCRRHTQSLTRDPDRNLTIMALMTLYGCEEVIADAETICITLICLFDIVFLSSQSCGTDQGNKAMVSSSLSGHRMLHHSQRFMNCRSACESFIWILCKVFPFILASVLGNQVFQLSRAATMIAHDSVGDRRQQRSDRSSTTDRLVSQWEGPS